MGSMSTTFDSSAAPSTPSTSSPPTPSPSRLSPSLAFIPLAPSPTSPPPSVLNPASHSFSSISPPTPSPKPRIATLEAPLSSSSLRDGSSLLCPYHPSTTLSLSPAPSYAASSPPLSATKHTTSSASSSTSASLPISSFPPHRDLPHLLLHHPATLPKKTHGTFFAIVAIPFPTATHNSPLQLHSHAFLYSHKSPSILQSFASASFSSAHFDIVAPAPTTSLLVTALCLSLNKSLIL